MSPVQVAVVGAHLAGQPLNRELVERGAELAFRTVTARCYRLYALATEPPKPGLVRVDPNDPSGSAIEVEVWTMPVESFGSFVDGVSAPLAIGRVQLGDGSWVAGFVCEPIALDGAEEITRFGGWRAFLNSID